LATTCGGIPRPATSAATSSKVHTSDFDYTGHTHRASRDDPQYEIKSDKTDHIAAHKGPALSKVGD
jgi:hypothetical protein